MRSPIFFLTFAFFLHAFALPAHATLVDGALRSPAPVCQRGLARVDQIPVTRLTLPFVNEKEKIVALTAVIPDFDLSRDIVIGINPRKHTYLINAQIGRYDPGIFGGRGKFHKNREVPRLRVSPGLIVHLRLSAQTVSRIAVEIERSIGKKNLTCTNTVARILARAGVPDMHALLLTPNQLLHATDYFQNLAGGLYMVNTKAQTLEDFEKQTKVVGAEQPAGNEEDDEKNPGRRKPQKDDSCGASGDACATGYWIDFGSCGQNAALGDAASSPTCESGSCDGSGSSECQGSDCGGSDCTCN